MTLPHFLCIGAQKAGTSWLFVALQQNPAIWMPPFKELHYFDHLFVPKNRLWTLSHIRRSTTQAIRWQVQKTENIDFSTLRYYCDAVLGDPFTEAWYEKLFDRPAAKNKIRGDITPEYSTIPDAGIRYLRGLIGAPKIIYIIREPVDRALSQLRMNIGRSGATLTSIDQWVEASSNVDIENRGDYATYIPRWKSHFAQEDILFLSYRRIASDPQGLIRDIENFLHVPHFDGYKNLSEPIHESKKLDVPEEIKLRFRDQLGHQRSFLNNEFGAEFL